MAERKPITADTRFHSLTVVGPADPEYCMGKRYYMYRCLCDCGRVTTVRSSSLRLGSTKSCGCRAVAANRERLTSHGHTSGDSTTPTYNSWRAMLYRCFNESCPAYKDYGGRGISVCDAWMSFDHFLSDMGEKPVGKSLDRTDNSKGYSQENCRWATWHEQQSNRRDAVSVEIRGKTWRLFEIAKLTGLKYKKVHKLYAAGRISELAEALRAKAR